MRKDIREGGTFPDCELPDQDVAPVDVAAIRYTEGNDVGVKR